MININMLRNKIISLLIIVIFILSSNLCYADTLRPPLGGAQRIVETFVAKRDTPESAASKAPVYGAALRDIGAYGSLTDKEAVPELPRGLITKWLDNAFNSAVTTKTINGEPVRAIFITDEEGLPKGISAYHVFRPIQNISDLVIITRSDIEPGTVAEEAAYTEARKAYWEEYIYKEGERDHIKTVRIAHILASYDQRLSFGKNDLTLYDKEQIAKMSLDKLKRIVSENRDMQHELAKKYFKDDSKIALIDKYEKLFLKAAYERVLVLLIDKARDMKGIESIAYLDSFMADLLQALSSSGQESFLRKYDVYFKPGANLYYAMLRVIKTAKALELEKLKTQTRDAKIVVIDYPDSPKGEVGVPIHEDESRPTLVDTYPAIERLLQSDSSIYVCIISRDGNRYQDLVKSGRLIVRKRTDDVAEVIRDVLAEKGLSESDMLVIGNPDSSKSLRGEANIFVTAYVTQKQTSRAGMPYIAEALEAITPMTSFSITKRDQINAAWPEIGSAILKAVDFMHERGLLKKVNNLHITKTRGGKETSAEIKDNTLIIKLGNISFLSEKTANEAFLHFLFAIAKSQVKPSFYADATHADSSRKIGAGMFIDNRDGIEILTLKDQATGELFVLAANFNKKAAASEKAWSSFILPAELSKKGQGFLVTSTIIGPQGNPQEIRLRKFTSDSGDPRYPIGLPENGCEIFRFHPTDNMDAFALDEIGDFFGVSDELANAIKLFSKAGVFKNIWRIVMLIGTSDKPDFSIISGELIIKLPIDGKLSLSQAVEGLARSFGKFDLAYMRPLTSDILILNAIKEAQEKIDTDPVIAAVRNTWEYKKNLYRRMVQPRPIDEVNRKWLEQNASHLKDRVIVSWQMEMAFHPEISLALLERLEKEVQTGKLSVKDADILLQKIAMSSMAGGLGALMPDLVRGMADNGASVIALNLSYDKCREDGAETGKWLRDSLKTLPGYQHIDGIVFSVDGNPITTSIDICKLGDALQVWINGLDELYKGDQNTPERAYQVKFCNAAGQAAIKELRKRGLIAADKTIIHLENESYTHLPKEEGDVLIVNHTVVAGGMPNYAQELFIGLLEQFKGKPIFNKAGRLRPEVLGAIRANIGIIGVSKDHTRILREVVFPEALRDVGASPEMIAEILAKIVFNNEYGSSNGTHPKHFQAPEVQDLIEEYKGRLGDVVMDDEALMAKLEMNSEAKGQFMDELDKAASDLEKPLLTLLRTQGISWSKTSEFHTGGIIRRVVEYKELRKFIDILKDRDMRERFRNSKVRIIAGGRFGPNMLKEIKILVEQHGLQNQVAVFDNYNISDAPIIMQGLDFTVMLAQKGKEAAATSPQKVASNGGAVIAVPDGICHPSEGFLSEFNEETGEGTGFVVEYDEQGIPRAESLLQAFEKMGRVLGDEKLRKQIRYNNLVAWMKIGNIVTHQARGILKIMDRAIAEKAGGQSVKVLNIDALELAGAQTSL